MESRNKDWQKPPLWFSSSQSTPGGDNQADFNCFPDFLQKQMAQLQQECPAMGNAISQGFSLNLWNAIYKKLTKAFGKHKNVSMCSPLATAQSSKPQDNFSLYPIRLTVLSVFQQAQMKFSQH